MFKNPLLPALALLTNSFLAQPQWQWAQKAGYVSVGQSAQELCVDSTGNVYALSINGGTAMYSSGILDSGTVLIKYDHLGNEVWARQLSFPCANIKCDYQSNIYISGWYRDSLSTDSSKFYESGGGDIFLVKLNTNGQEMWARSYGGPSADVIMDMAVSGSGDVYLTGGVEGDSVVFNNYFKVDTSSFGRFYIAKVDPAGSTMWVDRGIQDSLGYNYWMGSELSIDRYNTIWVIGIGQVCATSFACGRTFIAKYDATGKRIYHNWKWVTGYISGHVTELQLDDSLNFFIHMTGGGHHPDQGSLQKYDSSLNLKWTKQLGAQYGCWAFGRPRVSPAGNLFLTGHVNNYFSMGSGCAVPTMDTVYVFNTAVPFKGEGDIVVFKFDQGGQPIWFKTAGGPGLEYGVSPAVDAHENYYLTSNYNLSNTTPTANTPTSFDNHFLQNDGKWRQMAVAKLGGSNNLVSVKEFSNEILNLKVFPNPSVGKFKLIGVTQKNEIRVFDATGQQILHQTLQNEESTIDLSSQAKGMYIITFQDPKLRSLKVIKE